MAGFQAPTPVVNETGWGPSVWPERYENVPFGLFRRHESLEQAASLPEVIQRHVAREDGFARVHLPSTRPVHRKYRPGARATLSYKLSEAHVRHKQQQLLAKQGAPPMQRRHRKQRSRPQGPRAQGVRGPPGLGRLPSIEVQISWRKIDELLLSSLASPTHRTLLPISPHYGQSWLPGIPRLRPARFKAHWTAASNDPVLLQLSRDPRAKDARVFTTDAGAAALMGLPAAQNALCLLCRRVGDGVWLDTLPGTFVDAPSVDESAAQAPSDAQHPESVDSATNLAHELARVTQQYVAASYFSGPGSPQPLQAAHPAPQLTPDPRNLPHFYVYRRCTLDDGLVAVVRGQLDGVVLPREALQRPSSQAAPTTTTKPSAPSSPGRPGSSKSSHTRLLAGFSSSFGTASRGAIPATGGRRRAGGPGAGPRSSPAQPQQRGVEVSAGAALDQARTALARAPTPPGSALAKLRAARARTCILRAVLEYQPTIHGCWRNRLKSMSGAVTGQVIKNNAFLIRIWAGQLLLTGADLLRVGLVSRRSPLEATQHLLLGSFVFPTTTFLRQNASCTPSMLWTPLANVLRYLLQLPNGDFLLFKDPKKRVLHCYAVPTSDPRVRLPRPPQPPSVINPSLFARHSDAGAGTIVAKDDDDDEPDGPPGSSDSDGLEANGY